MIVGGNHCKYLILAAVMISIAFWVLLGNDLRQQDSQQGQAKCLSEDTPTIKYTNVHILPVKRDYLDKTTRRGKKLDDLKFDFSSV